MVWLRRGTEMLEGQAINPGYWGDRRRHLRVRVNAMCRVWSAAGTFEAQVEDISRAGLLFRTDAAPGTFTAAVGMPVAVDVALPPNYEVGPKCLHCRGMVVRTCENGHGVRQVAVAVAHMEFRDVPAAAGGGGGAC